MEKLTPRQQEILDLIKAYLAEHRVPPTRVEIAEELGFRSPNAAEDHLRALERKGAIELMPGASRGIRVLEDEEEGLPLVGKVAAGAPILAMENVVERYRVPPDMFHPYADYLLKVKGMSMKDAGIMEDDLLAVHKTNRARKGQIVVARLDDEVTVKRYEKDGRMVYLYPENEDFDVIAVDLKSEPFVIEGIAVGVIRDQL